MLAAYNNPLNANGDGNLPATYRRFQTPLTAGTRRLRQFLNFHSNVGSIYNLNRQRDNDTYTFQARASFDLAPASSDKYTTSSFGVWYEQRTNRQYDINPRALWQRYRQLPTITSVGIPSTMRATPSHRSSVTIPSSSPVSGDHSAPSVAIAEGSDDLFQARARSDGQELTEFVNVDD